MGECEGQGCVSGFVQALWGVLMCWGWGCRCWQANAHRCVLSGEFLGPRHAFRVFQSAHGTFVCARLSLCPSLFWLCVFVVCCFLLWVCSVFVALRVVLSFVL